MSLGQTLFHQYLGHRRHGGIFFRNHVHFHHAHYSGDHVGSVHYAKNEGNNTPYFLIPTVLVIGLSYLVMRLDLFGVQLVAMALSFYAHVYIDSSIILQDRGLVASCGSGESSSSIFSTTAMPTAISQ
jgi:hypothetical protein